MKKLNRLISWLDRFGFSEEVEILKEAGKGEAKLMRGSNFNVALKKILKDLPEDDESDVKEKVIELMEREMSEGDMDYFSNRSINDIEAREGDLKSLNKVERLSYYLSELYLMPNMFDIPAKYERGKVFKDYMSLPMFHVGGMMSKELNFFTPEGKPEISPDDYKENAESLNKHFEKFIEDNYPEKEARGEIEKVKIYSDGDYIGYIPGDKNISEDRDSCFSELRSEIGIKMGNCLGNKLKLHHCDDEKIYVYFSKDDKPHIMINIYGKELIEIDENLKGYKYEEKHFDRLEDFIFSNTNVMGIEKSEQIMDFFEEYNEDISDKVWAYYFNYNIDNMISKYQEMDAEDYVKELFGHLKLFSNSVGKSTPIIDPTNYNSVEIFDQARFDSIYNYISENTELDFDYGVGSLIILSNAFLFNPSKDNFLKIKNKLNMGVFNEFKKAENAQYKGISWILKMIFLTEEGEYEKLEACIKRYSEICKRYYYEPSKFRFSLIAENDDKYNDKGNSYFDQLFANYRFQINCQESDSGFESDEFRPFDDDHTCYSLKLSIIPSDFRMKRRF